MVDGVAAECQADVGIDVVLELVGVGGAEVSDEHVQSAAVDDAADAATTQVASRGASDEVVVEDVEGGGDVDGVKQDAVSSPGIAVEVVADDIAEVDRRATGTTVPGDVHAGQAVVAEVVVGDGGRDEGTAVAVGDQHTVEVVVGKGVVVEAGEVDRTAVEDEGDTVAGVALDGQVKDPGVDDTAGADDVGDTGHPVRSQHRSP